MQKANTDRNLPCCCFVGVLISLTVKIKYLLKKGGRGVIFLVVVGPGADGRGRGGGGGDTGRHRRAVGG